MATYTPSPDCFDAAQAAAKGLLNRDEINEAFQQVGEIRERLQIDGRMDGMSDRLRRAAEAKAERIRVAAALRKRHAALNVIVKDKLTETINAFRAAGLSPRQALLAVMEGTQQGITGGRNSVAALRLAYEGRYIGDMLAEIQRERPHIVGMLRSQDPVFDADIMREMFELRDGGQPGITGNEDARFLAKVFATYAEMSRTDLNRLGANIGKLSGWASVQTHDDVKMIAAGKEAWINDILPLIDTKRMFPDGEPEAEIVDVLGSIYDTIITGVSDDVTLREMVGPVSPANLAKSLGKHREIHFKDVGAALAYREKYGYGTTISGIIAYQRRSAQVAAQLERFGPNPEFMFRSIVDQMRRDIRSDPNMTEAQKRKAARSLDATAGSLKAAFDVMSGLSTRPVNVTAAKIGSDIRAVEAAAKLGGATLTAMPTDTVTAAAAAMFRGSGFFKGLVQQINGVMRGRPKGEQAEIAYLLGEGFDGLIGHIVHPAAAHDGPVGALSRLTAAFFRWNGLSWWTDISRATAARMIASEMGMRSHLAYDALPDRYRHVLSLHGIDATAWDAIRRAAWVADNGNTYVTPDRIRDLPDDVFEAFAADRTAKARANRQAKFDEQRRRIIEDARRELELTVRRFVADETNYGVVETDAQSERFTRFGTRPGTVAGEAARFIMQFKGFPVTFANRILGRAFFGGRGATKGQRFLNNLPHTGSLMAGLLIAGYMSMTMKDLARGYWPPRDPSDPKVIIAALQQGGALGIYGDFLFGRVNRFDGGILETTVGPFVGDFAHIVDAMLAARDGDVRAADWLNIALNTTPYINLFYTRPALDYLFLNSLRETVSPGYLRRQSTRRKKEFGQELLLPQRL